MWLTLCPATQVLFIDHFPILPFMNNLLTIKQHATENDARRSTTSFLPIVGGKGVSYILGQRTVQFMLQFVDVILCASFPQLIVELLIILFRPSVYLLPRVCGGRSRGGTIGKALHLDLTRTDNLVIRHERCFTRQ
jgi:hypothetical protein